ncbi:MAG: helicase-related protein, partial [Beijerinckiaceae bacterium]|nr:helicase-related protein [Beijerinckiaceae bacterium]
RDSITQAAIDELVRHGESRGSWLAFCSGVDHAKHVAAAIRERGYSCATIFGDTPRDERDEIIDAFKRGEIRALASMGVLTTGFNAPAVDLIAMLRPTKSAGLYVQMAGRGTRLSAGKENCLVLDFAGNVARHGPIDLVRRRKPGAGDGDAPTKVCPACNSILAISVMACPDCGHVFPAREVRIAPSASTQEILSARSAQWLDVSEVFYSRHEKPGRAPSLRVDYRCGLVTHSEWVCLEHEGYARRRAHAWWRQRMAGAQPPATVNGALRLASSLQRPTGIFVRPSGRYTEVVNHRFGPCVILPTTSAPSVGASRGSTAGSTPISRAAIPLATRAIENSAAGSARSSFTGGAA